MSIQIIIGDMRERLKELPDNSVDSCVCDPPYHLTNRTVDVKGCKDCGRTLGGNDGKPTVCPRCGGALSYQRSQQGKGFMGQTWDGGDVAFQPETWAEVLRVMKPGGHLIAFSGTRTYHRMAVAIEDAGFEVRDMISWIYGSGFPKSHDISKAIDRTRGEMGRELEFCAFMRTSGIGASKANRILQEAGAISPNGTTAGHYFATSLAGQPAIATRAIFEVLRPHLRGDAPARIEEIIDRAEAERDVVGQKTAGIANKGEGKRHTIGASKPVVVDITAPATDSAREWEGWGTALKPATEPICLARKPLSEKSIAANVLRWGTGALNIDATRIATEGADRERHLAEWERTQSDYSAKSMNDPLGATDLRQFAKEGRWPANLCHDGSDEVVAGFPETTSGAKGTEIAPDANRLAYGTFKGGERSRAYESNSGSAARFFYCAKTASDERGEGNNHPTVKPVALMRWLVRLVTPKGGTILDPFAGSGSTLIAADAEQFNAIGIELSPEYAAIAERRIRDAAGMFADVSVDQPIEAAA